MSDIRCVLIRRDLEQVEADLAAIRKSLSMAQEDFARAAREQEVREAEQEAALFERLKKDFADIPGPFSVASPATHLASHSGPGEEDQAGLERTGQEPAGQEGDGQVPGKTPGKAPGRSPGKVSVDPAHRIFFRGGQGFVVPALTGD